MLAVRIHGERVRETTALRLEQPVQQCCALATIARAHDDACLRVSLASLVSSSRLPSVLPSTTTQTGAQMARAARTVSAPLAPGL